VLLDVQACGVCRTDLHIRDGELEAPRLPVVLGHQVVARRTDTGERVGMPWLGWACGECGYCLAGTENLCDRAQFTGLDRDGGYAERCVADERFVLALPDAFDDLAVAPLLCAGLIGYRALRMAGDPARIGLYGFGASAHIVCQVAVHEGREVYAFVRAGDDASAAFARSLGAVWAGDALGPSPEPLDAGIHMSDIPSFAYADLWGERVIRSVANLTRDDGHAFLDVAPKVPVVTRVTTYPLADAERALDDLRAGRLEGAAVLEI
jgi:propanol-preferring alcohol dehydrogenase